MVRQERLPRPKYNRFAFTSFDVDIRKYLDKMPKMLYCVIGIEVAPTTDRLHYQGYIELKDFIRPIALSKMLGNCHVEPARCSLEVNYRYCTKGGNFFVYDRRPLSSREDGGFGGTAPNSSLEPSPSSSSSFNLNAWLANEELKAEWSELEDDIVLDLKKLDPNYDSRYPNPSS